MATPPAHVPTPTPTPTPVQAPTPAPKKPKPSEIKFETSDKQILSMDEKAAKVSPVITKILALPERKDPIIVSSISKATFEKVIEYCMIHKSDSSVQGEAHDVKRDQEEIISAEDRNFLKNVKPESLFDLISAADALEMAGLVRLLCRQVAEFMKVMKIEDIRKAFQITNDFTDAELADIDNEINFYDTNYVA